MKFKLSDEFKSKYKKQNVRIKRAIDRTLSVFAGDASDLSLHSKLLKSPYEGLIGIKIDHKTNDYRAIYEESEERDEKYAKFRIFGTHDELFNVGKNEKKKTTAKRQKSPRLVKKRGSKRR